MKGVRRKEREPGRTEILTWWHWLSPGWSCCQQMFAAVLWELLWASEAPAVSLSFRDRGDASPSAGHSWPAAAASGSPRRSFSVLILAALSSTPSPLDKHLVCRKFSPFPWPATGSDCSFFQRQECRTFPPSLSPSHSTLCHRPSVMTPCHRPSSQGMSKEHFHGGPQPQRAHIHLSKRPLS